LGVGGRVGVRIDSILWYVIYINILQLVCIEIFYM